MYITAETLRLSLDGMKLKLAYNVMDFCIVKFADNFMTDRVMCVTGFSPVSIPKF